MRHELAKTALLPTAGISNYHPFRMGDDSRSYCLYITAIFYNIVVSRGAKYIQGWLGKQKEVQHSEICV